MNNFYFEKKGSNRYLTYDVTDEDVDTLSLGMITNNHIEGLAQTIFMQFDEKKLLKYNIATKISVADIFSGTVNRKRLLGVLQGITNALISSEEYMLDEKSIILDMNYIFSDISTCETVLIILPVTEIGFSNPDPYTFLKQMVFASKYDQTESGDYFARIISYLNSTPMFSLREFKSLLDELENATSSRGASVGGGYSTKGVQPDNVYSQDSRIQQPGTVVSSHNQGMEQMGRTTQGGSDPIIPQQNQGGIGNVNVGYGVDVSGGAGNVANVAEDKRITDQANPEEDGGEKMSLLYLLQHYNKENAEIYKKQKKKKKGNDATKPSGKPPVSMAQSNDFGFAIPGKQDTGTSHKNEYVQPTVPAASQANQPAPNGGSVQPGGSVNSFYAEGTKMPEAVSAGKPISFGETIVLNGGASNETTVLGSPMGGTCNPYLIRVKNNEKIPVTKDTFRLGKEKSYVDYFIGDNSAVSRSHANILKKDADFFVVDINSTNHTFVNGGVIPSNVEIKLSHGTKIRLGNEDFEFYLY